MRHQVKVFSAGFDFVANPSGIANTNAAINVNVSALATGRAIGSTGTRIWDSNIVPAFSTQPLPSGGQFLYPLISTNLPNFYFDAIIIVGLDTILNPVAFSNAPDNKLIYPIDVPPSDKNLFWTDLYCFGTGNSFGANNAQNHFMFGGTGKQIGGVNPLFVHFQSPTTSALTIAWSYQFYEYINGAVGTPTTGSATVPIGSLSHMLLSDTSLLNVLAAYVGFGGAYASIGYWRFELTASDPTYRSMLPYYHHGQSN